MEKHGRFRTAVELEGTAKECFIKPFGEYRNDVQSRKSQFSWAVAETLTAKAVASQGKAVFTIKAKLMRHMTQDLWDKEIVVVLKTLDCANERLDKI